jgi:hypothetical protein
VTTKFAIKWEAVYALTLVIGAAIALIVLYSNMPKVSFDGMAAYQSQAEQQADDGNCENTGFAGNFERCTFPDGLQCVRAYQGGVTCNWDALNSTDAVGPESSNTTD